MKISLPLFILTISFLFGFSNVVFSQEKQFLSKGSLSIQGKQVNTKNSIASTIERQEEVGKYLNFNPVVNFSNNEFSKNNNNLIKKKSSLFVVFRSSSKEENNVLKIDFGSFEASLSNKKLVSNKEIILNQGNSKTGTSISYLFSKNSLTGNKDGNLVFDESLYNDKEFNNQLLELIYLPKILNTNQKNKVESYLAIKYGISLNEGQNYFNSKGDTIWNIKKNNSFNNRITGIGRDDFFGLNQKQSQNSLNDGLTIGIDKIEKTNTENNAVLPNHTFLIWGDNGAQCLFENKSNNSEKRMKRVWKIETNATKAEIINTQIQIDTNLMGLENGQSIDSKDNFWLAIDSTESSEFNYIYAKYIKAAVNDDKTIVFDNIKFDANINYRFTLIKAPDFFVTNGIEKPNCLTGEEGKLSLGIVGGTAPYAIQIVSDNYNEQLLSAESQISIENLVTGNYSLKVIDNNKKSQQTNFVMDSFDEEDISLASNWYLIEDKPIKITPKVTDTITDFEWLFEGSVVSTDKELETNKPGDYTLKVGNPLGCKKEISFKVLENTNQLNDGYVIFPNPLMANDDFTILFHLKTASKVSVQITDMSGKIIKKKEIGTIENYQFNETLTVSGTYLILVSINGVVETNKLIVK